MNEVSLKQSITPESASVEDKKSDCSAGSRHLLKAAVSPDLIRLLKSVYRQMYYA